MASIHGGEVDTECETGPQGGRLRHQRAHGQKNETKNAEKCRKRVHEGKHCEFTAKAAAIAERHVSRKRRISGRGCPVRQRCCRGNRPPLLLHSLAAARRQPEAAYRDVGNEAGTQAASTARISTWRGCGASKKRGHLTTGLEPVLIPSRKRIGKARHQIARARLQIVEEKCAPFVDANFLLATREHPVERRSRCRLLHLVKRAIATGAVPRELDNVGRRASTRVEGAIDIGKARHGRQSLQHGLMEFDQVFDLDAVARCIERTMRDHRSQFSCIRGEFRKLRRKRVRIAATCSAGTTRTLSHASIRPIATGVTWRGRTTRFDDSRTRDAARDFLDPARDIVECSGWHWRGQERKSYKR